MPRTFRTFAPALLSLCGVFSGSVWAAGQAAGALPEHPTLRNVPLGLVPDAGLSGGVVLDLVEFDDGSGPTLYAAGDFGRIGDRPAASLARRVDGHWWPLPVPTNGSRTVFEKLAAFKGMLYVGGVFTVPGAPPGQDLRNGVARWTGRSFEQLPLPQLFGVPAIVSLEDRLAVVGITPSDGSPSSRYAFWDGASLQPGPSDPFAPWEIATLHDGAVYATGVFQSETRLARWTGGGWSVLPGVFTRGPDDLVSGGDSLFAGGEQTGISGLPQSGVYRLRAGAWEALQGGRALPIRALGFLGNRLYVARSNSFNCAPATCASAVDIWENGSIRPPRFDRAGAATRIVQVGQGLVFGGWVPEFHETDDGGRGSRLLAVSDTGGVTPYMSAPAGWAASYLDLPEGPVMGGSFSHIGREHMGCVAQFREGRWQPLGGPLPTCNGPNVWSVEHLARGSEGVFAVSHAEQGASRMYLLANGVWSELPIPGPPTPWVKLFGAEGRIFLVGSSYVFERVGGEWLLAFSSDGGIIQQFTIDNGQMHVLGLVRQFEGDSRYGVWVRRPSGWEFLAGHPGFLTSIAVVNGEVYASTRFNGSFSTAILRYRNGAWETVYGSTSGPSSVGEVDGQLLTISDRGVTLTTQEGERQLVGCDLFGLDGVTSSKGFLLFPNGGSSASASTCVFANAHRSTLSLSHAPERPLPGQTLRFEVEVSAAEAPTGGVVEVMGLPVGGCVVRNLTPVSPTVSRGSCETTFTRNLEVEFTASFRGFVDADLKSWTPVAAEPLNLQITAELFSDSFEPMLAVPPAEHPIQ